MFFGISIEPQHGQGTVKTTDDKSIIGEWKEGKEWNTKHTNKDGKLIGMFENGEKIWGELYRASRNGKLGWYEEEWDGVENNKNIDYGKYVGGIQDGKRHGIGTYTWSDGSKYVGEYKNGKEWNGTEYDKVRNITGKVVNNKFIKQ